VCLLLVFTLYAYNFEFIGLFMACDSVVSMVGRVPLRALGVTMGRRLVADCQLRKMVHVPLT
jgi:hypothetical protein